MTESELKFREIENIYGEVVDRLDATTKYFNDYKNSIASERNYQHPVQLIPVRSERLPNNGSGYQNPYLNYPIHQSVPAFSNVNEYTSRKNFQPPNQQAFQPTFNPTVYNPVQLLTESPPNPYCYPCSAPLYCPPPHPTPIQQCPPQTQKAATESSCPAVVTDRESRPNQQDLNGAELLVMIIDGYIQQCGGMTSQQENKTKLMKLRRKIMTSKNIKPKTLTKFMEYAQSIGLEVIQAVQSCNQATKAITQQNNDETERKTSSSTGARTTNSSSSSRLKRESYSTTGKTATNKPLSSINGITVVPFGQAIQLGSGSSQSQRGQAIQLGNGSSQSQRSGHQSHSITSQSNPAVLYNEGSPWKQPYQISPQDIREPEMLPTPYQQPQLHDYPTNMYSQTYPYSHPWSQWPYQQMPHSQQQYPVPQCYQPCWPDQWYPQFLTTDQTNACNTSGKCGGTESMQSEVTHSATGADQPLSKTISTQYHDVELEVGRQEDGHTSFCLKQEVNRLSKEVKEQGSSLNKAITRLLRDQHVAEELSEEDEKPESIIEKLERKSLNIPEGTLVTDGLNVFYVTKPNITDHDGDADKQEIVVNIPIQGKNLVKQKGDSGNSCKICRSQRSSRASKMRASEKIADVLDGNDDPVKETPKTSYTDTTAENKDNLDKKKKAKSHSTIADFETCICSNCFPDQDETRKNTAQTVEMFTPPTSLPDMTLNKELSLLPVPVFLDNSPHSDLRLRPSDGGFVQAWSPEPPMESYNEAELAPLLTIRCCSEPPPESLTKETEIKEEPSESIVLHRDPPEKAGGKNSSSEIVGGRELSSSTTTSVPILPANGPNKKYSANEARRGGRVISASTLQVLRMRECLEKIFAYLDTANLLSVAQVSREWKVVARRPSLWHKIEILDRRISAKFLHTLSTWCTQVETITLQGIKTPKKKKSEPVADFLAGTEGTLEPGLESILKASHVYITTLSIIGCSNLFTEKILSAVGSYCPMLKRLAYVSAHSPAGRESLLELGRGCKMIDTLLLPPLVPCRHPTRLDDECCEVIGSLWPDLKVICTGGEGITANGLVFIAKLCQDLQILELDRALPITKKIVEAMTYVGLKNLELIELNYTKISAQALKAFGEGCHKLAKFRYDGSPQSSNNSKASSRAGSTDGDGGDRPVTEQQAILKSSHSVQQGGERKRKTAGEKRRYSPKERIRLHQKSLVGLHGRLALRSTGSNSEDESNYNNSAADRTVSVSQLSCGKACECDDGNSEGEITPSPEQEKKQQNNVAINDTANPSTPNNQELNSYQKVHVSYKIWHLNKQLIMADKRRKDGRRSSNIKLAEGPISDSDLNQLKRCRALSLDHEYDGQATDQCPPKTVNDKLKMLNRQIQSAHRARMPNKCSCTERLAAHTRADNNIRSSERWREMLVKTNPLARRLNQKYQ